jgi:hypothetical protein
MLNEKRVSFLKKSKLKVQSLASKTNYPRSILDKDMKLLWDTFIKSPSFKSMSTNWPKDPIAYNFNTLISWNSFLSNNHYTPSVDFIEAYRMDILHCVKRHIRQSLSNLKQYKIVPLLKVSQVSYQLHLPPKTMEATRVNTYTGAKIKILLTYVPTKAKMIDLRIKQGAKLTDSTIDSMLNRMQGYLFRERPEYLKYQKPATLEMLMKIPHYQWYVKDGLRFRHNGTSLALSLNYDYPGSIPMTDAPGLLKEFDKIMSNALRSL